MIDGRIKLDDLLNGIKEEDLVERDKLEEKSGKEQSEKKVEPERDNVFDIGEMGFTKNKKQPEYIDPEQTGLSEPVFRNTGEEIDKWLEGLVESAPPTMAKMMDDVTNKMVTYVAYLLVRRLSQMNGLVDHLAILESRIFSQERLNTKRTVQSYKDDYNLLAGTLQDLFEFTRKFSSNSSTLIKDTERDEVMNKLRSLDSKSIKDLKKLIDEKIKTISSSGSLKKEETTE